MHTGNMGCASKPRAPWCHGRRRGVAVELHKAMDWYCFTFWFLAASASGFQVYHGCIGDLSGSTWPLSIGKGTFPIWIWGLSGARYLERAWTCLEHFGTTKNALAMLPVYLYLWSYLEVHPKKSQWSRNHLPVTVHFKACWSSSQNTWWILIWLAVLDMICHHRNGTIFTDLPQWQPHIFQGAKNHQSLRVFPSHFPSQFMEMMRFRGLQVRFILHGKT